MFGLSYSSCRGAFVDGVELVVLLARRADPSRGRAVRLALASPGCESSLGGLNYVVSYTEFADKTFRSVRGQKVAQHHKVINSSFTAKTIAQIRMKFVVALALLPLSAAIVGGARAASVHVNWAHTKDDLRTRYNSARAHATKPHAAAASPQGAH